MRWIVLSMVVATSTAACSGSSGPGDVSSAQGEGDGGGSDAASNGDGGATSDGGSHGDSGSTGNAPTWSQLWKQYLATGTIGHCVSCHGQMGSASNAYTWLQSRGQISGAPLTLVSNGSRLTWFGGNMPPGGPTSSAQAVSDFEAWAAAGAHDN